MKALSTRKTHSVGACKSHLEVHTLTALSCELIRMSVY